MQHEIYYVNNKGDRIDFTGPLPYRMVTGTLFNYAWGYNTADDYRNRGAAITTFRRELVSHTIDLDVFAATEEAYTSAIDALCDIADYDVNLQRPGRLYANGSYLDCYITASSKEAWESPTLYLTVQLTLVAEFPTWWRERTIHYGITDAAATEEADDFVLADDTEEADFPYEFAADATNRVIDNSSAYRGAEFILRFHGPAHDPNITIGDTLYSVTADLAVNELLEINSYRRTIVKRNTISGAEENLFGSRSRDGDIFERIPAGYLTVYYSGDFDIDLTLLEDRSEPRWTS